MKRTHFLIILSIFLTKFASSQTYTTQSNGNSTTVIAVTGLEKDDRSLLEFFKQYPVWEQVTKENAITIEFLGFEKENSSAKPFKFGKSPVPTEDNPVLGSTFIKNDGMGLAKKIYFDDYGTAYWSTGTGNSSVKGTYNYNVSEGVVYLNMPQAKQQVFYMRRGSGKNLGITGEAVENVSLIDKASGESYTKQTNQSEGYEKKPQDLSWLLPENRYLIKYTLRHDRFMTENGRNITKKDQIEEKKAFITKFTVVERESQGSLANDNIQWQTVYIEAVAEVNAQPYTPGTPAEQLARLPLGMVTLKLITHGQKRNEDAKFQNNADRNRIYINTALNRAGWDNKDGALSTASGVTYTYDLSENYYVSPAKNGGAAGTVSFGSEIDANCTMTFQPIVDTKGGVKLGDVIVSDIYKLEANSALTFDKLRDKSYKFELVTKKIFGIGKEKSKKGTWSVSPTSQTVTFKFDDGSKREFPVTQIRDGYMYQFKDGDGTVFLLNKVDAKK